MILARPVPLGSGRRVVIIGIDDSCPNTLGNTPSHRAGDSGIPRFCILLFGSWRVRVALVALRSLKLLLRRLEPRPLLPPAFLPLPRLEHSSPPRVAPLLLLRLCVPFHDVRI